MSQQSILIIEDEPAIADTIIYALKTEGFKIDWSTLAEEGIQKLQQNSSDLIILDVGLPDINGFEACKLIRKISDVPIIFLTARGDEIDRIVGLEIGADDYMVKPFSPRELTARVKVILRRSSNSTPENSIPSNSAPVLFDSEKRTVTYFSNPLSLTSYEYGILELLTSQPERVFSREQLIQAVWNEPDESFDRVVDTHIKSLRSKLKEINASTNPIKTHRGIGYSYIPEDSNPVDTA